jgi:hypothetical protein
LDDEIAAQSKDSQNQEEFLSIDKNQQDINYSDWLSD